MKTKKLLSVILSLVITVLSLSFWTVSASAAEITPSKPDEINGVYQIGTAAELYGFAELVNSGNTGASAVLTKDIVVNIDVLKADGTLNSGTFTDWTPIGDDSNQYTGTFDGQGYTISGLYFNNEYADNVGLFGYLGSGEIKNVGVIDSYFNGYRFVGGVCGDNNSGIITGCYNTGTVSGVDDVGGVCGDNNSGTITGCYNTGTVSSDSDDGGVCGANAGGIITGCYTNSGGVYGDNNGTVIDCEEYTGDEFKDGTVCGLLNKAIGSDCDFMFYQGEETPLLFCKTSYQYCTVNYAVAPSYTVTIPQTVTLGETVTIKAENVVLEEDKQLEVTITGTSGDNNAFTVKSAEGAVLEYTVTKADGTKVSLNDKILTVNPDNTDTDSTTLTFNTPGKAKFSGEYKGTVTFNVSIN